MRSSRIAAAAAALLLSIAAFAGCAASSGEVAPTPMFASDEEAFAAAEATYRAYVDALNSENTGSGVVGGPEDYLVGTALEQEIQSQRDLHDRRISIDGIGAFNHFEGVQVSKDRSTVEATLCLDATATRVRDSTGADVTPPDRVNQLPLGITFVFEDSSLLISRSVGYPDGKTCG